MTTVFKRLRWMLLGAGFGAGTSLWVMRAVRARIRRFTPERISADMTDAVRTFGADVRAAASDGFNFCRRHGEAVVPGAGHWLMEESPAFTVALIQEFLRGWLPALPEPVAVASP